MTTLALEFSSARRSVALARDGVILGEATAAGEFATNAFAMIDQVLKDSNCHRDQIEAIAVGLGPGSYTGIRAAIALAQGWELARGVKLLGISSVAAIAEQSRAEGIFGSVNVVVDAQRGEFYLATWKIAETECREISDLRILTAAEIEKRKQDGEVFAGPETGVILFPSAAMVVRLAAKRDNYIKGESLLPTYLRETNFVKAAPIRI